MKKITFIFSLAIQFLNAQSFQEIHDAAILVDTHNDILMKVVDNKLIFDSDLSGKTHSDLARLKTGGVDVQLFSVYCDGDRKNPYAYATKAMDSLDAIVARNPNKIVKVANYAELIKAVKKNKIAAMFGIEGGHMIEDDLDKLNTMYNRGARYLTLTHNIAPSWATSAADETANAKLTHKGLTDFGKKVVERMNQLGMLIDVSHAGEHTFWDVIETSTKPIIASHSAVYSLVPNRRNLKDDQIKAIAKKGGVIQVNFHPGFIDKSFDDKEAAFLKKYAREMDALMKKGMADYSAMDILYKKYASETIDMRPPLSMLVDHIEYIIKLVGVDYVGLGSDFDGINVTPQTLDDVTNYPLITEALIRKGYSAVDINKILGENFLRLLEATETK
jgi:membrane dipeptidase